MSSSSATVGKCMHAVSAPARTRCWSRPAGPSARPPTLSSSRPPLPITLQLLVLGDRLLSLGRDGRLLVWRIGQYDAPEVAIQLPRWGRHGLLVLQKGCVHAVAALDSVSVLPDTGAAGCDC